MILEAVVIVVAAVVIGLGEKVPDESKKII
jgi:hypothetical protein